MKFAGASGIVLLLVLGLTGEVNATGTSTYPGYCYNQYSTIYACFGNMTDIANQTEDPNRYALFQKVSYETSASNYVYDLRFYMNYQNVWYSCAAPSNMLDAWNSALASRGLFYIVMDTASGTCITLQLNGGSPYKN